MSSTTTLLTCATLESQMPQAVVKANNILCGWRFQSGASPPILSLTRGRGGAPQTATSSTCRRALSGQGQADRRNLSVDGHLEAHALRLRGRSRSSAVTAAPTGEPATTIVRLRITLRGGQADRMAKARSELDRDPGRSSRGDPSGDGLGRRPPPLLPHLRPSLRFRA